ncbi:hypothetical protein ASPCADRAFT_146842 [Aspergillus carbonarius ITEM 5010]|uniref:Uncharacterized protein n=1 Tax=Aspergillus carbonarius (strain ITEM 5010) TaxID=602072 RepID=A0A1R3RNT7_ASPC5|nr:hypothetical protein ASPCADRAFT_146842 [Aspergillus carbonarius ITEM 5010]
MLFFSFPISLSLYDSGGYSFGFFISLTFPAFVYYFVCWLAIFTLSCSFFLYFSLFIFLLLPPSRFGLVLAAAGGTPHPLGTPLITPDIFIS